MQLHQKVKSQDTPIKCVTPVASLILDLFSNSKYLLRFTKFGPAPNLVRKSAIILSNSSPNANFGVNNTTVIFG